MIPWAGATAIALALAASGAGGEARVRTWTRGAAPALAASDLEGRPFALRSLRGRVVLVHFWASWCEPCVEELPSLASLRARLRGRPFELVLVNFGEGRSKVERFVRDHAVDGPVLLDREGRAAEAWGVVELPMSFLVDVDGRVRSVVPGEWDWNDGPAAAALERLLGDAEHGERRRARAAPPGRLGTKDARAEPDGSRARP
ncbi:MAG TPA: TlpA disulfide reductase family protein [Anaeromyxobacter sp.]|nr:TlpA disulfide reductase family protein [Anaeromyxobacter sp.]